MAFSDAVKLEAKRRSAFRCCICHRTFVEVHHIKPEAEGGSDDLENAATLCAGCHDLFGGNPEKRRQIRQMRDHWWDQMTKRARNFTTVTDLEKHALIAEDPNHANNLSSQKCWIYHVVFADETFEMAANTIGELLIRSERQFPGLCRHLGLDIEGHRNDQGGFDHDMWELQRSFILGALSPFFSAIHMPLVSVVNSHAQCNDLPDTFRIFPASGGQIVDAIKSVGDNGKVYVADLDKWIQCEQ